MPGKPFLIGVAGGTSSGKTSVCKKIVELLDETNCDVHRKVAIISQESFYRHLTKDQLISVQSYNFDHPDAFDTKLMKSVVKDIVNNRKVSVPVYDTRSNTRIAGEYNELSDCDVILFEGILVFYHKEIRDLFNMKLFVDIDADTRLSRRVLRDTSERGRCLETVLHQYTTMVKPAFEEFCLPTKKYADIIIPRGVENKVAINLIVQHLGDILNGGAGLKYKTISNKSNGNTNGAEINDAKINDAKMNGACIIASSVDNDDAVSIVRH